MNLRKPLNLTPVIAVYAVVVLFLLLGRGISRPPQDEADTVDRTRIADYDIRVRLDPDEKQLLGHETITWLNADGPPTDRLMLHLYMNAFRSPGTRYMSARGGWSAEEAGWIDIKSIKLPGGGLIEPESAEAEQAAQIDEDLIDRIEIDETVMTVHLPRPIETGARIRLEIEFEVKLPRVFSRAGYASDYYLVAQWFPKTGVYADGRWICPQYESYTEFYADFGRYRVEITVPNNYRVGATGYLDSSRVRDGEKTLVYTAHPVHDFAWAASPNLRETKEKVEYRSGGKVYTVDLFLLMQRDRMDMAETYKSAVRLALESFGREYGPYPYSKLTVIDPAPGRGLNSGGMEYPMFITGGSSWLETYLFPGDLPIEGVTIHEFGHQYWYGVVANNEFDEPWIDEGLTSYSADKAVDTLAPFGMNLRYPKILSDTLLGLHPFLRGWRADFGDLVDLLRLGLPDSSLAQRRADYLLQPGAAPITAKAYRQLNEMSYSISAYHKPALVLKTLEGIVGEPGVSRILRRLYERFRFRHVKGDEIRALASEVAGEDLSWFFDQVLDGTGILDYAVDSVETSDEPPANQDGEVLSIVTLRRLGEVILPQTVRVTLDDGRNFDFKWDRKNPRSEPIWMESFEALGGVGGSRYRLREGRAGGWLKIEILSSGPVASARVDPGYRYPLDLNLANNSYRTDADSSFSTRGEMSAVRLLAKWLHGISVFN